MRQVFRRRPTGAFALVIVQRFFTFALSLGGHPMIGGFGPDGARESGGSLRERRAG